MAQPAPKIPDWVSRAIDLGLDCFADGDHAPFVIIDSDGDGQGQLIELQSMSGTIDAALLEQGRSLIRQLAGSAQRYLLVYDGYLTRAGHKHDALFAEAGIAGERRAYVFAQCYRVSEAGELERVGQALIAGEVASVWAAAFPGYR